MQLSKFWQFIQNCTFWKGSLEERPPLELAWGGCQMKLVWNPSLIRVHGFSAQCATVDFLSFGVQRTTDLKIWDGRCYLVHLSELKGYPTYLGVHVSWCPCTVALENIHITLNTKSVKARTTWLNQIRMPVSQWRDTAEQQRCSSKMKFIFNGLSWKKNLCQCFPNVLNYNLSWSTRQNNNNNFI